MTSVDESTSADAAAPGASAPTARAWPTALWLVPLVLTILIPGLRLQAYQSMHAFRMVPFLYTVPIVAGVGVLVLAGLSRGFRVRVPWALGVTAMVLLVGFLQADLNQAAEEVVGAAPGFVGEAIPVLVSLLAVWLAVRMAPAPGYYLVVTVAAAAIFLGVAVINLGTVVAVPEHRATAAADPARPDVLLLVLDGYARDDVLAARYGFDNEPFLSALTDRGFAVPRNATANYTGTYGAVAAMYSFEYPVGAGPMRPEDHDRIAATLAGDNAMMQAFAEAGYAITFFENGWDGSTCPPAADVCVRDGLWGKTLWDLGGLTLLSPIVEAWLTHPFASMAVPQMERLEEIVASPGPDAGPRLIVAHITVPHPPLHLDAACTPSNSPSGRGLLIREPGMTADQIESRLGRFGEQTQCVNATTVAAVDTFLEGNPDGIVMVTADHGPDSMLQAVTAPSDWSREAVTERTAIMSAYRVPDDCAAPVADDITPVNGARLVRSCALGMPFDPLPNRSYTIPAPGDALQEVIDLSRRVDANP